MYRSRSLIASLAVLGLLPLPARAAPPKLPHYAATNVRKPLEQREPRVLLRAARIFSNAAERDHGQNLNALERLAATIGYDSPVGAAIKANALLDKLPVAVTGKRRLDTTMKKGLFGESPVNSDQWNGTLRSIYNNLKEYGGGSDRIAQLTGRLHEVMDKSYRELPTKLTASKPEELVRRAVELITVLDHKANHREVSSQKVGSGYSSSSFSHQTLLTSASGSSSSSWSLSQLLPESTSYTFNVTLFGVRARIDASSVRPGHLPVEARRFVQMGLELNAISRELTRLQHPDGAKLASWINNSKINFQAQGTNSYYPHEVGALASVQLARAPADVAASKELLERGVISAQLVRSLKRDPVLKQDAGGW